MSGEGQSREGEREKMEDMETGAHRPGEADKGTVPSVKLLPVELF